MQITFGVFVATSVYIFRKDPLFAHFHKNFPHKAKNGQRHKSRRHRALRHGALEDIIYSCYIYQLYTSIIGQRANLQSGNQQRAARRETVNPPFYFMTWLFMHSHVSRLYEK